MRFAVGKLTRKETQGPVRAESIEARPAVMVRPTNKKDFLVYFKKAPLLQCLVASAAYLIIFLW